MSEGRFNVKAHQGRVGGFTMLSCLCRCHAVSMFRWKKILIKSLVSFHVIFPGRRWSTRRWNHQPNARSNRIGIRKVSGFDLTWIAFESAAASLCLTPTCTGAHSAGGDFVLYLELEYHSRTSISHQIWFVADVFLSPSVYQATE